VVTATEFHPINTAEAERSRMRKLEQHLRTHELCPAGYRILDRTPPFEPAIAHLTSRLTADVSYTGICI